MGGAVDFIDDAISDTVDFVDDAYHDTVDYFEDDLLDDVGDIGTNIYHSAEDAVSDVYDTVNDAIYDVQNIVYDAVDFVLDKGLGVSGSMKFMKNLTTGIHAVLRGIGDGNWQAIKAGVIIAVMIVVTVLSFGAAAPFLAAAMVWGIPTVGAALLVTFAAISMASSIYSMYGLAVSIADIGEAIRNGSTAGVIKQALDGRAALDLAMVNAWINGSMNLWMAGGVLYDAPRAGDVLFNPTGSTATTRFLNLQDKNDNTWSKWNLGRMHEFHRNVFGSLAGSDFFAVSPLAQRI